MRALRLFIVNIEEIAACTFLLLMSAATFGNVIARYGFDSPIPWAEELARYSFLWLIFIGAAVCTKRRRHIAIDVLVKRLPASLQMICEFLANLCIVTLMGILVYYGTLLTISATQPTSTLEIPTYFVYVVVPLSAFSVLIRTLTDLAQNFRKMVGAAP
jgi:TRAP-type C4-dicarboxylate transport system permease small subunit